jgi:hypothetical protein
MSGWISVEDRLLKDEKVLISYGEPFFGVFTQETECAYFDGESKKWLFWLSDNEVSTNGVTHWMPLPPPPEQMK